VTIGGNNISTLAGLLLLIAVLVTSTLSGVFGMAGGLILMGVLALLLPVSAAFVMHGLIQLVANGWRAILHRRHIDWGIIGRYAIGSVAAAGLVGLMAFVPSRPLLYLLLGLVPALVWVPRRRLQLDAARPAHAMLCGLLVTGLNLLAGVSGPLLDIFFVRTDMGRHRIVATKAATQVLAHLAKIVIFGGFLIAANQAEQVPLWLLPLAVPLSIAGTVAGGRILDRLSDANFLKWTRWLVTLIGIGYLVQAARLAWG
jgi:uncharacterized membrane protein YfcA